MRRQRYSHTLADSSRQEEIDDASSYSSVSALATRFPEQLNWAPYSLSDATIQQHWNELDQRQCRSDITLNPSFLFTDIYNIYNNVYQSNYSHSRDAIGNASNSISFGPNGQRRLSFDGSCGYHQHDHQPNGGIDGQLPYPNLIPPQQDSSMNLAISGFGTVFLVLRNMIRIDITPGKGVYVTNNPARCVGVLGASGEQSCIIHPNGKILEESSTIVMESYDKTAKICQKGVIFTSTHHVLAYLVDASGTKSTSEKFQRLHYEYSFKIFYGNTHNININQARSKCQALISESTYRNYGNGEETWTIGDIRVKQNSWGEVRVTANSGKRVLQTSPAVRFMSITTPMGFMKVDYDPVMQVRVEKGDKSIVAGQRGLTVKNGSQRAGLNRNNRLVLS